MERCYEEGLVSVITPVYNASRHLSKMLDSVLAQTYKNIEIILVDDCSNDNSAEIIREYQKSCSNITYFKQPENKGAGYARNKALELGRGQYAAFLDSDDIWMPDKIEKQIHLMKETGTPFCYGAIEMIDENDQLIKPKRNIRETCDYNYLLHNTVIATSSVVVDRMVLGDFRMHLRRGGQDYATWLKLLRGDVIARGINEVMVRYRVASGSLSSNKFKSIQQVWEIQTGDEKIGKGAAAWHLLCFTFNACKKYFF